MLPGATLPLLESPATFAVVFFLVKAATATAWDGMGADGTVLIPTIPDADALNMLIRTMRSS